MARANKKQREARRRAARDQAARAEAAREQASRAEASRAEAARGEAERAGAAADLASGETGPPTKSRTKVAATAAPEEADAFPRGALGVAFWALLAAVFLVPIAMSNITIFGADLPFTFDVFDIVKMYVLRVCTLVALAAWAWHMLRRGGTLRHTPIDWLILVFLGWVAITTVTSIHWPMAFFGKPRRYDGLLSFVNYAILAFLVMQFAASAARVRDLARALFFSSLLVAGYGALQFLGWDPFKWAALPFEANRAFSTYGNPDLLGGFLIFSVTVALGLVLSERRLLWRMIYWAGFGLNGLVLIVAFTRGAWIGGFIAVVLVAVMAWRQRVRLLRVDWVPVGISAALGLGVIWRSFSSQNEVMNFAKRLGSIFQFSGGSGQTRTEIWQAALGAIGDRPLLGWGADTFRLVFMRFEPAEYVRDAGGSSIADNAHNYPLQLAAGVGIPGMLLFYGIFVWAGIRSFRTVFARAAEPQAILRGAFWAAAVGYLVQLFAGLSVTGTSFLLWTALGVVLAPTARLVTVPAPRWGTVAAVVALGLAALGVGYTSLAIIADYAYIQGRNSTGVDRVNWAEWAVKLSPYTGIYRTELGLAHAATATAYLELGRQAQEAGEDTTTYAAGVRAHFKAAEEALKDAIAFEPDEYDNYVALADLYNLGGESLDEAYFEKAITVANEGLERAPYGTALRKRLARAYAGNNQVDRAIEELEYVTRLDPRDAEAVLSLAGLYVRVKRSDDALELLREFNERVPGQTDITDAIDELEASATSE
ncbi:MAG: O-antigen ligase family protein [Thermoleophilia bacterium]